MTDHVHPLWTEDELDTALADLHRTPPGGPDDVATARTALYTALGTPEPAAPKAARTRRHWPRWAGAAAAVAAIVAASLVLQGSAGPAPKASAAALTLQRAAAQAIGERDQPLGPGQYRYLRSNAWAAAEYAGQHGVQFMYLSHNIDETWVPADQSAAWMLRRSTTGERQWVIGSEQAAHAAGIDVDHSLSPADTITAPCGDFYPNQGVPPSCADIAKQAGWQWPTPAWLATLPDDPTAMLARLRHDAGGNPRGDAELLTDVADALRTGLVPAHVRALLYQALAMVPDLQVTQRSANLDGHVGVAMGIDSQENGTRQEIIIDPATGQFIGEREVATRTADGIKAGTLLESSSVTTSVVDALGVTQ